MPGPLRALIGTLSRIFWADMALEFEQPDLQEEGTSEALEADLAAAPAIALGMLQVLVVEARDLAPVHGMGTNPYVRGVLGQHVRRTPTAWSDLGPAWNCLMDFPVVSPAASLELEVMSRAPLFGGDTRIGYVSLPLRGLVPAGRAPQGEQPRLAYRCEPLAGAAQGQLVLILDWRALPRGGPSRLNCFAAARALVHRAAQFRAFFLYHYWPCDKSIFQMYLKEPVDAIILLISLSPFLAVRAVFYTVLLACLCIPWPPDEHQIVQFILAFKGTAIFTDGAGRMLSGILTYYSCVRAATCASGATPGSGINSISIALDLYQEVLVWCVCFFLLPRSITYGMRTGTSATESNEVSDIHRGGRIQALLQYNLLVFLSSTCMFAVLCAHDILGSSIRGDGLDEVWAWRIPENFFWSRTLFGFGMFPFLFLLHPQINKLLTHSTPTGYTRLGTLRRYNPRLRPKRPKHCGGGDAGRGGGAPAEGEPRGGPPAEAAEAAPADPVRELVAAVQRLPGGAVALCVGGLGLHAASASLGLANAVVSAELRAASGAISIGSRAVRAGVSTAQHAVHRVPGSGIAVKAGGTACSLIQCASSASVSRALQVGESASASVVRLARQIPGGSFALDIAEQVSSTAGSYIAAVTSPDPATEASPFTIGEKAEALKLEAAARLAEMLTRAERAAEREAIDVVERIRPEIGRMSEELCARSRGFRARVTRAWGACDALRRSVLAAAWDVAQRLPAAGETLHRASLREWADLRTQRPPRAPGWLPLLEACCRAGISALCEASLELRPRPGAPAAPMAGRPREPGARPPAPGTQACAPRPEAAQERRPRSQGPGSGPAAATQVPEARPAPRRTASSSVPPRLAAARAQEDS